MNISSSNSLNARSTDPILSQITAISKLFDGGSDREIEQAIANARMLPQGALDEIARYRRGETTRPAVRIALNELYDARRQALQLA